MSQVNSVSIGVGFDTARYGHRVAFLRPDLQPAAKAFTFTESSAGYAELRQAFEQLQQKSQNVHFYMRIDAAGQYAANLEQFLRSLPYEKTISVGQPKQNRDYCNVHFPKRKADAVDALACARFAIVEQPAPTPATPAPFAQLQELASALESQTRQTTRLINQLHNHLARVFPELACDVSALSAAWVLRLLQKYPTPAKIAGAHIASLLSIPHLTQEKAEKLQAAARQTVASFQGPLAEALIRESVSFIQQSQKAACEFKGLLEQAYDGLPAGAHRQIETIPGIGKQTAAVLVAKIVDIARFKTPGSLVNYFGIFPEENTSGVDKFGRPVPPGTQIMSRKGNDLARRYLWNAAKTAILHNPVIRSLYARQRTAGKRGDVALGHCMRKLLHLVFAVWTTNQPFAPRPAGTDQRTSVQPQEMATAESPSAASQSAEDAGGRKGQSPERRAVTPASSNVPSASSADNGAQSAPASATSAGRVDFRQLRKQISMEQVLRALHAWDSLKGGDAQRRGPCPIHQPAGADGRSFSVNPHKNDFQCFDASCGAQGNVLDLWAQSQRMTIAQAAHDLAGRFGVITD